MVPLDQNMKGTATSRAWSRSTLVSSTLYSAGQDAHGLQVGDLPGRQGDEIAHALVEPRIGAVAQKGRDAGLE